MLLNFLFMLIPPVGCEADDVASWLTSRLDLRQTDLASLALMIAVQVPTSSHGNPEPKWCLMK
jgi:hypothetical protein